jgi:hypothetical protein
MNGDGWVSRDSGEGVCWFAGGLHKKGDDGGGWRRTRRRRRMERVTMVACGGFDSSPGGRSSRQKETDEDVSCVLRLNKNGQQKLLVSWRLSTARKEEELDGAAGYT